MNPTMKRPNIKKCLSSGAVFVNQEPVSQFDMQLINGNILMLMLFQMSVVLLLLLLLDAHHQTCTILQWNNLGDRVEIRAGSHFRKPSEHKHRFEILYEDEDLFVVGKPVNILVSTSKEGEDRRGR